MIKPQDYDEILKMVFSKSDYELFNKKAKYQLIKKLIAETEILIKKKESIFERIGMNKAKNEKVKTWPIISKKREDGFDFCSKVS